MQCPKCEGQMWDNRQQNVERVAKGLKRTPDFKCKNEECGHVIWPPKDKTATAPKTNGITPQAPRATNDEIIRQSLLKVAAEVYSGMGVEALELMKYSEQLYPYIKEGFPKAKAPAPLEDKLEQVKQNVLNQEEPQEEVEEDDLPF